MNTASSPQHAAPGSSFAQSTGFAAGKGVALILLALVIGVLLLTQGLSDGEAGTLATAPTATSQLADPEPDLTVVDTQPSTTSTVVVTTTAAPVPARSAADTPVIVANGNGGKGVAGDASAVLIRLGYNALRPVDTVRRPATIVYHLPTWDAEASAVAQGLGIPIERVQPMPGDPGVQLGTATVLVVLGEDGVGLQPG